MGWDVVLIYLLLTLFAITAFELFLLLRMSADATALCKLAQESVRVLILSEATEHEKELLARQVSGEIVRSTWYFTLKFLSIVLALYFLFVLITIPLPHLRRPILNAAVSPVALVVLTIAVLCYGTARRAILASR